MFLKNALKFRQKMKTSKTAMKLQIKTTEDDEKTTTEDEDQDQDDDEILERIQEEELLEAIQEKLKTLQLGLQCSGYPLLRTPAWTNQGQDRLGEVWQRRGGLAKANRVWRRS